MDMTEEQIEQNAEEYAKKHYDIPFDDNSSMNVIVSEESYIAGAHSRDEEVAKLKRLYEEVLHKYYETECKLRNPWISGERHPTDVTKDYLLEYEDRSHIVAMWDSGMWMSKDLHPLKNPKKWIPIPELKKGE